MKTDRILKLIQQKNVMRSGGALPLPKAQSGRDQFLGPTVEKAKLMFPTPAPELPLGLHPYVDFVDTRVMDPVVPGKVLEATRKHDILGVPREQLIKTIEQAREVGTDPATLAAIFGWETRLGETDPQLGHSRYHDTPTIEGLDEFSTQANIGAQSLKDQLEYGKKIYPKGPFYKQLQAYQGYGPLYPDTEKKYYKKENQAFFGIPVTKENPLRTNKVFPYGKTIQQYRDSVIIPTLEKYGIDYKQSGGSLNNMNVSDVWKQVTGSDWSQAKKLGLTDGSYEQNVALKAKLIANAKQKPALAEKPKISVAPKPAAQKPKYKVQIPGVQRDATSVAPSAQQRAYEFYSKQPFGVTDPNSRIPQQIQASMMQAATQPDAVYQTPTGVRSSLQSAYNQITNGTENDLANIVTGAIGYPLQAGLNISNTITGDVPIRSDADVLGLGLDVASLIPAAKFAKNFGTYRRAAQNATVDFLHPLTSNYRTGNITQKFLADESRFPGLEVIRKGSRSTPKTVTVKDVNKPDQYLRAIRNKDGSYHFHFDMSGVGPRRAGTAMQLLENQFKPLTQFKEISTLSLDSYKNVLNRMSDPRYSVIPSGRTTLNVQGVRNKFLDDLADPYFTNWDDYASGNMNANAAAAVERWNEAGAPMYFSTKSAATKAAEKLNLKYFGKAKANAGDEVAMPVKGDNRKWTISVPNFQLTKLKELGGSTKVRIKKRK